MNRRKFLKSLLGTGMAAGSGTLGSILGTTAAHAHHVAGAVNPTPTVVIIFQRGGCDGLNTVVPYGDPNYTTLRPTIGIAAPNGGNPLASLGINDAARGHTNFFGLNPNMSALLPIFNAGDLAVMPAVHYPNNTHSHFSGQDYIESGVPRTISNGWAYRHLESQSKLGSLQGLGFGRNLAKSLRGNTAVQSLNFLNDFGFPSAAGNILTRLKQNALPLYNEVQTVDPQMLVHNTGQIMFNNIDTIAGINAVNYTPANGATYPGGSFGRRLREIAQLIKNNVGLEVVTVDQGGYDTHSNQGGAAAGGRQSTRLREFSNGIAALYTDLGQQMDNVIILTATEFGRTAKENGSAGTDHGDAASWFMVGKGIQGGIHGAWPGLSSTQLARGRYLNRSLDYRDIYADILINHLGHTTAELPTLLPGHTHTPVGVFA